MSDVLQEARRQTSLNGELPFAIQLELYVDDRDVVAELDNAWELTTVDIDEALVGELLQLGDLTKLRQPPHQLGVTSVGFRFGFARLGPIDPYRHQPLVRLERLVLGRIRGEHGLGRRLRRCGWCWVGHGCVCVGHGVCGGEGGPR